MRTLYLDCGMGAAGDMLTAALSELLPDQDAFFEKMNALGIPGVHFEKEKTQKCGITGTHSKVTVNGEEEESLDVHHHDHDHHHDHEDHHHDHDHGGGRRSRFLSAQRRRGQRGHGRCGDGRFQEGAAFD